ncbi:ABC transporter ATP-binding protein [Phytoactinopolyspora limicola]|uniref:ABC transporter ATP-binding protein n=1 Tax=Phytoactinopolyspora limicola TaxID=2715536 RepID=UPI00140BEFE6|nr:ABC transporter ATP-binding protein [Phytoactinopolyspora limicola]
MLRLNRVWKTYRVGAFGTRELTAVRDVSLDVAPGEVVSLIGESGSGKTTIGRMVLRLNSVSQGRIEFDGTDVSTLRGRALKSYYRKVQGIFQDPYSSFNPIFKADRVFDMVRRQFFAGTPNATWHGKIEAALADVRLDPAQVLNKYPHQLSGGQLQRMLIARALLLDIKLLIADEIISMLDASTRIDVMNLLADLTSRGVGVLFVTHDLALGNYLSTTTVILRRGVIVEMGATDKVFANPQHPYSTHLLGSVPHLHKKWSQVEAELARHDARLGPCGYHAHMPGRCGMPPHDPDQPMLAEIEPGHVVGCSYDQPLG